MRLNQPSRKATADTERTSPLLSQKLYSFDCTSLQNFVTISIQGGDNVSLVRKFAEKILIQGKAVSFATSLVGNKEDAEDIVSESVYQLLRSEDSLIEREFDELSIRQYFYRILRYRCYRYWSSQRKRATLDLIEDITPNHCDNIPGDKLDLSEMFGQFDEITRTCLLLVATGQSHSDVGKRFGIKPEAVWARLDRARKKLQALGFTVSNSYLSFDKMWLLPQIPPKAEDGNWLTVYQLAQLADRNVRTVKNRLQRISLKHGIKPKRHQNNHNQTLDYWPSEVLELLRLEFSRYPDGGDWLSVGQLAAACKQDPKWIRSTLKKLGTALELRRASNGKIHPHYPPETLLVLNEKTAQRKNQTVGLREMPLSERLNVPMMPK